LYLRAIALLRILSETFFLTETVKQTITALPRLLKAIYYQNRCF